MDYEVNSYVAVTAEGNGTSFWIARIIDITRQDGFPDESEPQRGGFTLNIHWYEQGKRNSDPLSSTYRPAYLSILLPWKGEIGDDTVIISFSALTTSKHIPMPVWKLLENYSC